MTAQATGSTHAGRRSGSAAIQQMLARIPLHLALIGAVVIWSVPTIALLVSSFRDPTEIASSGWWRALTEGGFTFSNYDRVLEARGMGRAFVNSLLIAVPSTILVLLIASMAAYAISWMEFPGRNVLFLVMVGLLVVPLQMTLIPVLRLYTSLTIETEVPLLGGRVFGQSSYFGIWLAHAGYGMPFAIYLLRNFFGSLPRELIESAQLDGASDTRVFFRIILPLSVPALAALAIFQFLWVWNDLLVAMILMGDPDLAPMTLTITNLVSSFGSQYQLLTAAAFISMAVPLLVFFALQRYFVRGLLAGSTKG